MKITVNGQLRVYERGILKFEAYPAEVELISLMGGRTFEPPTVLKWLPKSAAVLQFALVSTGTKDVILAHYDKGFYAAIAWLEAQGWKIKEAKELAIEQPYVRQVVKRVPAT